MGNTGAMKARDARRALGGLTRELAALDEMTAAELAVRFEELFGFPTRTRNRSYLRKRVAWKIQEQREGGLSERALARIEELAPLAPARWRQRSAKATPDEALALPASQTRDPRLPAAGTVLQRTHGGETHEVLVHEDDFEYRGTRYASLSQVAKAVAGTPWNGFLFFGLAKRSRGTKRGNR